VLPRVPQRRVGVVCSLQQAFDRRQVWPSTPWRCILALESPS
jgi:hypothetical protein